jgi:hypothetical protein
MKRWWGNLEQRDILKDVVVDGRIILESVLIGVQGVEGIMCFRTRTRDWLLWTR